MADFPASQLYSQPRPVACPGSACVIVNGRRVPVGHGATGNELAARVGGPGRRAVILSGTQARPLEDGRFYTPAELKDSRGMPVRISSIPDRTKGGEPRVNERVLVFLDHENLHANDPGSRIHYGRLLSFLTAGRSLVEAYAYVPLFPSLLYDPDLFRHLHENGWKAVQKCARTQPANLFEVSNPNIDMGLDIIRIVNKTKPDILVICSGSSDFIPVINNINNIGIRTELASFKANTFESMPFTVSRFYSLDAWLKNEHINNSEEREFVESNMKHGPSYGGQYLDAFLNATIPPEPHRNK